MVHWGPGERPRAPPEKAPFSSLPGHLTQKTLAWVFKAYMERDFTAPWQLRYLAVAGGTRATLERCTAACLSMHESRDSRERGKTLNVDYPTNLTRFFI